MILAKAVLLTGFIRKFRGICACCPAVKVGGRLAVCALCLFLLVFSDSAVALMASAPMVQEVDGLAYELQDSVGLDVTGQPATGVGVSMDTSDCRMLRVAVRIVSGAPVGALSGVESASKPHRLGNAVDTFEYQIDVCENTTGLLLFDEHHPFVRRMLVQGGRDPGYGQEIDSIQTRQGFTVHPIAAGEFIRLILHPRFGQVSSRSPGEPIAAPEVIDFQVSNTVDAIPGQWMELGSYRKESFLGGEISTRRRLGNSREVLRIWVKVDDVNSPGCWH
jgi:hypothetical protein